MPEGDGRQQEQGEGGSGENGGQRDIPPEKSGQQPDKKGGQTANRQIGPQSENHSQTGGDTFAAFEFQVDGEDMAEDCGCAYGQPAE